MAGVLIMGTPRLNLVTLGVRDMARARAFYGGLGFKASPASQDGVTFFEAGGVILSLFGRSDLASDAAVSDTPTGFAAIALAWNVESEAAVDDALARAVNVGARITKSAQRAFWGGYSGYFSDPDGHLWEIAYNPFFPLDADGHLTLPSGPQASDTTNNP
jgi:catechol 2,3-dioxygenase-like lactoylglutathione lyase family enzyme